MTKHTFAKDEHPHNMTSIVCHLHKHKLQADSRVTYCIHQQMPINAILLQHSQELIFRNLVICFFRLPYHVKTFFAYSQDFSKICLKSENLICDVATWTKTTDFFSFQGTLHTPFMKDEEVIFFDNSCTLCDRFSCI